MTQNPYDLAAMRKQTASMITTHTRSRGDKDRLDFLERFINEHGVIVLHDGNANVHEHLGLGLRPGHLKRTLRQAIDSCTGIPARGSDPRQKRSAE